MKMWVLGVDSIAVSVFVLFYLSLTNSNRIGKKNKMWGVGGGTEAPIDPQGILATLALTAYTPHYCCNLYYKSYGTNFCSNVTDEVLCDNMRVQLAGLYLNNCS